MKTNSTFIKYAVLSIVILFTFATSKGQSTNNTPSTDFNFNATPTLFSGVDKAIGAKYRFNNVTAGTYAEVTIVAATGGASVDILDDNTTTKPEAFSPKIAVPKNSNGMVEFKIAFFNSADSTSKTAAQVIATAMDIDGSGSMHEEDALNMGAGAVLSYQSSSLEINVVKTGNEYLATNVAGNEYDGVDTSAKQVMFTVSNTNIPSFTYRAGANNGTNQAVSRQKGIYFKGFNYATGALPVKYSAFGATVVDKAVILKWTTEQEINNSHFEVERSFDGTNFSTIAIVLDGFANGNQTNYQYKDNSADLQTKTVVYYRLKQVDNNGTFSYTNTLVVKLKATEGVVMQTSPNPFTENLNVRFTAAYNGSVQIDVLSTNGQTVLSKQVEVSKGYVTIQLDGLSKLAPGMYIARLTMNGVVAGTQKIIKN